MTIAFHIATVTGCKVNGTIVYLAGCTAIAHFVAISIERATTMLSPLWAVTLKGHMPRYVIAMVVTCWTYGIFWSIMPLFGKFHFHTLISFN